MEKVLTLSPRWQRLRLWTTAAAAAVTLAGCATPPEGDLAAGNDGVSTQAARSTKTQRPVLNTTANTSVSTVSSRSSGNEQGNWNLFGVDRDEPLGGHSFDGLRPDVGTFEQRGEASWYGKGFHGRRTANGERFDMAAMTAAHPSLPLDSWVLVRNLRNNKLAVVRINDRGPYHRNRVLDVSYAAAKRLGFSSAGAAQVEIRRLSRVEVAALKPQIEANTDVGDGAGDDDDTAVPVKRTHKVVRHKRH